MSTAAAYQVSVSIGSTALRGATPRTACKAAVVAPVVLLGRLQAGSNRSLARSAPFASSFVSSSKDLEAQISLQQSAQRRQFGNRVGVNTAPTMAASSAYDFSVKDIDGNETDLSKFKGKVSLIVNVASACGLTKQNYQELTTVYDKLKEKDFEVLAFPCNQFGGQEPGSAEEIKKFAGDKYKASYPLFSKVDVNGAKAEPLFQYLKKEAGGGDIAWNFGKFLVDKDGKVVKRFDPRTNPLAIEQEIEKIL